MLTSAETNFYKSTTAFRFLGYLVFPIITSTYMYVILLTHLDLRRSDEDVYMMIACLIQGLEGFTLQMETQLPANITSGYNRRLRPGNNREVPMGIYIDFYMGSLKELSEGKGKISIAGGFQVSWADSRLTWKPADYDGDLFDTSLFVSDIWTPNFVLMNPYYNVKPIFLQGRLLRMGIMHAA